MEHGGFGDYYGLTTLHPLALVATILLSLLVLGMPRRLALMPLFVAATTLPMAQRIVIAGADFTLMRVLLLAYLLRVLFRKEYQGVGQSRVDVVIFLWSISGIVISLIHYGPEILVNRVGWAYDILLTYLVSRCLVRSTEDIFALAKVVAIVSVPVAATFLYERLTQHNPYAIFGGVNEITWIRDGRLRCQGPFAHPLLAGAFWASLIPLLWMLWHGEEGRRARRLAVIGICAAMIIVVNVASSTSIMAAFIAALGIALFRFRKYRRPLWIGLIFCLCALHVIMEKPVWHLIARIDLVGGSTGWHRYSIINAFINNFGKWWLTGESDPMSWGVYEMRDITNQYILEGVRGGLLTLTMFVLVLGFSFGSVGRSLRRMESLNLISEERIVWLIGTIIFMHTVTFFGISYFGQMSALFYMQLALAGSIVPQLLPRILARMNGDGETAARRDSAAKRFGRRAHVRFGKSNSLGHTVDNG